MLVAPRRPGGRHASAALIGLSLLVFSGPASAQKWWPFGGNDEPPRPREPVYRQPQPVPAPIPNQAPPPAVPGGAANWSTKNPICLQLEQRLLQEGQKGNQSREQLPKLEAEIRQVDKTYNVGAAQLDKSCYEYFLFTKSFRSSPQCKELLKQVEVAKRRLAELEVQRQDIVSTGGRSYQDDIVRELARNGCGANYVDQARRREGGGGGGVWQEEDSVGHNSWTPQTGTGVATYRTLCVRLCDGYYFPVSFSTLPSHFPQDAEACQSKCAAPTELYYHPNPGGSVDQSVALKSQEPYTRLKVAFRYRKEFVNGCSCKEAEFVPATLATDKKAETPAGGAPPVKASAFPAKRAEGAPPPVDGQADAQPGSQITTGTITPATAAAAAALAAPEAAPAEQLPPVPMQDAIKDVLEKPAAPAVPVAPKRTAPTGAQPPQ